MNDLEEWLSDWKCSRCGDWINGDQATCPCSERDEAAAAERADVVAWLRSHNAPAVLIDGIVAGDHEAARYRYER